MDLYFVFWKDNGKMLTIENLEKELNSNSLRSLYLLYGEELF